MNVRFQILEGHFLDVAERIPDESIHVCVTSPPYYGLRTYSTVPQIWSDPTNWTQQLLIAEGTFHCDHEWVSIKQYKDSWRRNETAAQHHSSAVGANRTRSREELRDGRWTRTEYCELCSAWRGELGQEPSPSLYIAHLVQVFAPLYDRILHPKGSLWVNLGDAHYNYRPGKHDDARAQGFNRLTSGNARDIPSFTPKRGYKIDGLKEKDLIGLPWLFAQAMQAGIYKGRISKEGDRRWLAAIMDGEGSICGNSHERKDGAGPRTALFVTVTNTNTELLNEVDRIWPAHRRDHMENKNKRLGKRDCFRWLLDGGYEAKMMFLRELYPHLIAKRKQAIMGYTLASFMENAKSIGHSPLRDEYREKRKLLCERLSDANKGRPFEVPDFCVEPPPVEIGCRWYWRSEIHWHKPNPLSESVEDRPTKAHEAILLFTKEEKYYYDKWAITEPPTGNAHPRGRIVTSSNGEGKEFQAWEPSKTAKPFSAESRSNDSSRLAMQGTLCPGGRNKRTIWTINVQGYKEEHFAAYPEELPEIPIKAGSSEVGCCSKCREPYKRIVLKPEKPLHAKETLEARWRRAAAVRGIDIENAITGDSITLGWRANCNCYAGAPVPCRVLDPFLGRGTTGIVALRFGRDFTGVELQSKYVPMARRNMAKEHPLWVKEELS